MKRFLITESEKNRILTMHKKAVKNNYLKEALMGEEPIVVGSPKIMGTFFFGEGQPKTSKGDPLLVLGYDQMIIELKNYRELWFEDFENYLKTSGTLETLEKFINNKNVSIPAFIEVSVGTSSTPGDQVGTAQNRRNFAETLLREAFNRIGLLDERIGQIILNMKTFEYKPSNLDLGVYDQRKVKANDKERFAAIKLYTLQTVGSSDIQLDKIEDDLEAAANDYFGFDVNEEGIVNAICSLGGYSDIKDIDRKLNRFGGLEGYINSYITDSVLPGGSDTDERNQIVKCLNQKSNLSGKGDVAFLRRDKVVITLK